MRVRIPQPPSPPGLLGPDPGRFNRERPAAVSEASPSIKIEMMPRSVGHQAAYGRSTPRMRCGTIEFLIGERLQFKDVNEAPIMAPGFSRLPLCKMTANASTPSNFMASIGIVKFSLFPFQLPSLTQRRTTLV